MADTFHILSAAASRFAHGLIGAALLSVSGLSQAQISTVEFVLDASFKHRHANVATNLAAQVNGQALEALGAGAYRIKLASPELAEQAARQLREWSGVSRADRVLAAPSVKANAAIEYHSRMLSLSLAPGLTADGVVRELAALTGQPLRLKRVATGNRAQVVLPRGTTPAVLAALSVQAESLPGVLLVERVRVLSHLWQPNDALWAQQWALHDGLGGIRMAQAWALPQVGGATVAVIDTGIRSHPDLDAKRLAGYDFISNEWIAADGDGRDPDATDVGDYDTEFDCSSPYSFMSSWHGTHVSGIIAASTHNGEGMAGVSPESRLVPVRALGRCGGTEEDVADAVRWAAGAPVTGVPANRNPARVINMSLGGYGACSSMMQSAIDAALSRGAVIVVAAGNDFGPAFDATPANCRGVVTVAANQLLGDLASYSNYGPEVTLSAPGGDSGALPGVISTLNGGVTQPGVPSYATYQGTSMAAPHVAGVAALMLARDPSLTPGQVRNRLASTARTFPAGTDCAAVPGACGAGILNAAAALASVNINLQPGQWSSNRDRTVLTELRNEATNRFVLLSDPVEIERYLADRSEGRWSRTGFNITTHSSTAMAQVIAVPQAVCRARLVGGSFSYSANTQECLDFQNKPEWVFDGYVFTAAMPDTVCPRGSKAAMEMQALDSRGYNLRTVIDAGEISRMQAQGWTGRRIAFCVPD